MIIVKSRRRRSASVSSSGRGVETILLIAVLLLRSANSLVLEYYDVDAPFVLGVKTTYEPGDDSDKVTVDMKRPVSLKTKPGESHNVLRRISIRLPTSEMNLLWNAGKHKLSGPALERFLNDLLIMDYDIAFNNKYGHGFKEYDTKATTRLIETMRRHGLLDYVKLLGDRGTEINEL